MVEGVWYGYQATLVFDELDGLKRWKAAGNGLLEKEADYLPAGALDLLPYDDAERGEGLRRQGSLYRVVVRDGNAVEAGLEAAGHQSFKLRRGVRGEPGMHVEVNPQRYPPSPL